MRILHILDHSIPLHSGYSFRTLAILEQQRARGWETFHLTSPKQENCSVAEEHVDGWHFYRTLPGNGLVNGIPGLGEIELIGELTHRLEQVVRRVKPHVLHAHSPALNAIPALRVGHRLNIPVVYEVRAFWEDAAVDHGTSREWGLRYRLTRALETYALKRVDAITTICEGLRSDIVARGIAPSKVTVIPNAVDIDKFSSGCPADPALKHTLGLENSVVLGFIGSFYAYEGLAILLRALPKIIKATPNARLLLVGGGAQEAALKQLAQELAITDRVIFTGRVAHSEVQAYYNLIDVLVYPRLSMRLTELVTPLKPLEAMAQGRLLIASDVGGHRELIRDGETGMLFKAGDASALAEKVTQLLSAPTTWPTLRVAARHFVESERNWPASVARYQPIYERLTGQGS